MKITQGVVVMTQEPKSNPIPESRTYNGWKNRATWNVALWINNDYGLYNAAVDYMRRAARPSYRGFVEYAELGRELTPDGIHWLDSGLDYGALDRMLYDLAN